MSVSISQPSILAQDDRQALLQVKSYLFQLSQQLNYAFSVVDGQIATASAAVEQSVKSSRSQDPENTFLAIKGLIIKSADIVNAYSEAIEQKLHGEYVAQSAFGTYKEQTEAAIQANSKNINTVFSNVQEMLDRQIASEGYIRTGLLDYKISIHAPRGGSDSKDAQIPGRIFGEDINFVRHNPGKAMPNRF